MADDDPRGRFESEASYFRRRADRAYDDRLTRLEMKLDQMDTKVDLLTVRMAIMAAVVSVVIIAANIIGPVIAARVIGAGL
jgi:hypothetical protein